jgi:hypothetical protein
MKDVGLLLLGIWLVATGLKSVAHLSFQYDAIVLGVLAMVAGVLVLVKR